MAEKTEGVADTLYIPLSARIYVSERFPEFFKDEAALSLKDTVPRSVFEGSSEYTHMASVCRYLNTDEMAHDFVKRKGHSNVVYLGCGLETANRRLEDLDAHFYDMDLPEVVEDRRKLLTQTDNETVIAGDMFDLAWAEGIDASVPTMILALGVFQYFTEEQITGLIRKLKERFPGAELVFDATNTKGLKYINKYVEKTGNTSARMYLAIDDPREFAVRAGIGLLETRLFYTCVGKDLKKKLGFYTRVAMRVCDRDGRSKIMRFAL